MAYYKEALSHDASRVDIRLALERATRMASQNHMARARQLEQQRRATHAPTHDQHIQGINVLYYYIEYSLVMIIELLIL